MTSGDGGLEPSTRDYCSERGARELAQAIEQFWKGFGHSTVRAWAEPVPGAGAWAVRSSLRNGLPDPVGAASRPK